MGIRPTSNNIDRRLKKLQTDLGRIPGQAHRYFQSITPIDTGNARRSTDLVNTSIVADYDYANRLNTGYSRQAPAGTRPPATDPAQP